MRAIEKRAADRWQSAEDMHDALEPYVTSSGASQPVQAVARKPFEWTPQRIAVAAGIVGIIAAGLIASTIAFRRDRQGLAVANTRQVTNASGLEVHPAISPDGRMVAYVAGSATRPQLFLRQLSGGRSIALTDSTKPAEWPRWKPDGSELLYISNDGTGFPRTFSIPALGGNAQLVPGLDSLVGCSWSNAGDRVVCTNFATGALVIAGSHGENRRVIPQVKIGDGAGAPAWSPDDKVIAFALNSNQYLGNATIGNIAPSSLWLVRTDGGNPVRISDETHLNTSPAWTPDGTVLYVSSLGGNRDIYMQRVRSNLSPDGEPVRLTTGLNAHTISIDRSGKTIAYSVFNTSANIWSTPIPQGSADSPRLTPITSGSQTIEAFAVSRDEKWIVYDSNLNGNQDIFTIPIAGGDAQQLTHNGVDNFAPSWSPDGRQIAFHTLEKGNRDIYVMDANGGNLTPVVATPREELVPQWTPDGAGISFATFSDSLFMVRRAGAKWSAPRFWLRANVDAVSPDGARLIAAGGPNVVCADCPAGIYLLNSDLTGRQPLSTPKLASVLSIAGSVIWSSDSRHAFLSMLEKDGTSSIWQLPINGDAEKRVIHLTDPMRQFYRNFIDIDSRNFYLALGDRQSDIWTMELKKP